VLVVVLAYGADGPWRAAHDYWAALIAQKQYPAAVKTYGQKSTEAVDLANAYFTDLNNASTLNPWEASYPAAAGINFGEAAVHSKSASTQISDLAKAHTYLQRAVNISPMESKYRDEFAQVLVDQAKIDKARGESALATKDLHQAVSQLRNAVYYDPRDQAFRKFLSQTVAQLHPAAKSAGSAGIRSTTSKAAG
jgi:tetratricopeptide (TPR) repeat protein